MASSAISLVFPLQNPQANCAAMAQTWLHMSLSNKAPVTQPHLITSVRNMTQTRDARNLGGPSMVSLASNNFTSTPPVILQNTPYNQCFSTLMNQNKTYPGYYITIKFNGGQHAMAAWLSPYFSFLLEPDSGLWNFTNNYSGAESLAGLMDKMKLGRVCPEFKIYSVVHARSWNK